MRGEFSTPMEDGEGINIHN